MSQLKFIYNSPFKDSHSHPIDTSIPIIARNDSSEMMHQVVSYFYGHIILLDSYFPAWSTERGTE